MAAVLWLLLLTFVTQGAAAVAAIKTIALILIMGQRKGRLVVGAFEHGWRGIEFGGECAVFCARGATVLGSAAGRGAGAAMRGKGLAMRLVIGLALVKGVQGAANEGMGAWAWRKQLTWPLICRGGLRWPLGPWGGRVKNLINLEASAAGSF